MAEKRRRLAIFSPLSPVPSGIADYCEISLEILGREFDISVVVDNYQPETTRLPPKTEIIRAESLSKAALINSFDLPIYHIGNSPHHNYIYPFMFARPGLLLLHDAWIMGTRLNAALQSWQGDAFRREMHLGYGEERGWDAAEIILSGLHNSNFLRYFPMSELLVDSSRMTLVHQHWLKRHLEASLHGTTVRTIPHYLKSPPPASESELQQIRGSLNLKPDTFVMGMFGGIVKEKRPEVSLRGLQWLKQKQNNVRMLIVGSCGDDVPLESLINKMGLSEDVIVMGRVSDKEYFDYMQICDCQLLLRWPTNRESSGVLINAMNLGQTVITANLAHFAEFPESSVLRVDVDKEELHLRQHLLRLSQDSELRKRIGESGRAYAYGAHGRAASEKSWKAVIAECLSMPEKEAVNQEKLPEHLRLQ
jgi:glycosyltransferase involved in cell wall biosynthesis